MLGTALAEALREGETTAGWTVHGVSRSDFDIAHAGSVRDSVEAFRPDVVVHAAAHAVVDECEADPALALRVNVAGVRNVAEVCRRVSARLVYISSDYVFDGADTPAGGYREDDLPSPLSVYGATKLAGERIAAMAPGHLTVRTSWLFGGADERLDQVLGALARAARGERPGLIADQYSLPTYTVDLARALAFLLTRDTPVSGTVHAANAGTASWYEVGRYALEVFDPRLARACPPTPVAMADCGFHGGRPRDSSLCTDRLAGLGHTMPAWPDAVRRYCDRLRAAPGPGSLLLRERAR
jgi:dTDP-4-dehydrorhamnose reductase